MPTDEQLIALAQAVVPWMTGDWQADPPDDRYWVTLRDRRDGNLRLSLSNTRERGKVSVSVHVPHELSRYCRGDRPSIGVSATRAPGDIAADIERRLLPAAREYVAQAQACFDSYKAAAAEAVAAARRMIAVSGGLWKLPAMAEDQTDCTMAGYLPGTTRVEARVSNSGVSLTTGTLPVAIAQQVVALLVQLLPPAPHGAEPDDDWN